MMFASWPALTVALGALAIGAILYALQRLRTHRRVVRIASAPLWSQAARTVPPRVLGGRFRRPLAFLLALSIAAALWLAASRPERIATPDGRFHHFVLDASALMTQGDAFGRAQAALTAQLAHMRPRDRDVYLDDGTLLLAAGEDGALLPGRLTGTSAVARPSGFRLWLARTLAEARQGSAAVHYFGHRSVFDAVPRPGATTQLIAGLLVDPVARNHSVVGLGVSPAASGGWGRADVLVALWDSGDPAPSLDRVGLRLAGRALAPAKVDAIGSGRYLLRDIPAEGQSLAVAWRDGDGFAADDSATIRIPDRRTVAVAVGSGVPATILRALRLDPAFRVVDADEAQVVVRTAGDRMTAASKPSLILTAPAVEAATFVVTAPDGETDVVLADRLDALGLRQIDASSLADDLGRAVAVREGGAGAGAGAVRSMAAWRTVFSAQTAFARSPALPLFVSQSLRWLAGPAPWIPYAQAGAMLPDQSALYGLADDPALDARRFGDGIYLARAGDIDIAGQRVAVSLTDIDTSRMAVAARQTSGRTDPARGGYPDPWIAALLLAAAVLLALERRLFQRGWMP